MIKDIFQTELFLFHSAIHPALNKVREYKSLLKIHTVIQKEKNKILNGENAVVNNNERLRILRLIFSQPITYYNLKTNKHLSVNKFDYTTKRDYILNSKWL